MEDRSRTRLRVAQTRSAPTLAEDLAAASEKADLITTTAAATVIGRADADEVCAVLLETLGYKRMATSDDSPLRNHWSRAPSTLHGLLSQFVALLPLTHAEAELAALELGLPDDPPWRDLLADDPRVIRHQLGWTRASRQRRDVAYLWLKSEGEPRVAGEIARVAQGSEHAISEAMRRDPDFAQVRPEGTWALTDWRTPGTGQRYASAEDVVVEVLRELGPLAVDKLRAEAVRRYPVSEWRINQCLSSNQIGQHADGTLGLLTI